MDQETSGIYAMVSHLLGLLLFT